MIMYKSRWHMAWLGMTVGASEAQKLGLGDDYQNWTPLLVHAYQLGVAGGFIGAGVTLMISAGLFWILITILK
jgi:hypothetical protein